MANTGDGASGKATTVGVAGPGGIEVPLTKAGIAKLPRPTATTTPPVLTAPPPFTVSGRVVRAPGTAGATLDQPGPRTAITKAVVRAFDRELRREVTLGEARTNAEGHYLITYTRAQLISTTKRAADLVVRVFDDAGALLLASPVIFGAAINEVVDLVYQDPAVATPAELERHATAIRPVLADVELASLSDDEILFTAVKSRVPAVYVGYLAIAQRLAATTRLPADVLYALFRAGLPTQLPALLLQPAARIRTALAAAVAAGTAPASVTANVDATLATMRSLIASHVLTTTDADGFTLAPILAASGATAAQQAAFVARYVDHDGDDNTFWDAARADATIGPAADSLAFAIGAGILSRDNVALVKTLVARRTNGNAIHALVGLAAADWEKLIRESGGTVPDEITGDTADARIAAYAADLVETLRAAFPSLAAGLHVAAGTAIASAGRTDLGKFFANAPEFAFEDTRVRDYLAANRSTALAGVVDEAALTANLERVQRLYRVAPRGEHVDALLAAGLDSAHAIAVMSSANFVADHAGSLGGTEMAMMVYQKSAQVSAAAKVIGTGYYQWARGGAIEQPPDLETLFGPIDSCECDECQSVYGAASYLVDVLQFLRTSSTTPFTVLMQRRPDLQYLQLTCENTLTPLPLIDLANEILEYYVGHPDFKALTDAQAQELAKNTTSDITVAQLSLTPQYAYLDAYETLRTALRSPKLPFDRWLETIRAYLALLGTSRYEILDALLPVAPAADLARATLDLSLEQWNIIIGSSPATTVGELYGFPANTADATWRNQLCVVEKLLARADIAYTDLVALVNTLFVNPTLRTSTVGPTTVVLFSEDDSCDLTKTYLQVQATVHAQNATTGLQAPDWRRIAQFLRLWRTLGWSIPDVDRALTALGVTTLTEPTLIELAQLEQLRADLDIPVAQLVSLWAPLDTFGAFSLYAQLFQNRALLNPPDPAFDLAASGSELQTTGQPLEAHKAAVLAGLRLGATDLDLLASTLGITTLSLVNLSALYRHVVLARALDLTVADLLALVAFTTSEVDPFAAGAPALTRRFVGIARAIAETELSVAQLAYAFQAKDPTATIAPLSDTITALLAELQDALRKIVDDNQVQPDASGALLRAKLGMALDATLVDRAMAVIDGKPTPDASAFVVNNFTFCSAATQANLVDVAFGNVEIRRAIVLGELLSFLRASRSRGAVNQALADALAIDSKVVSYMLETAPALSSDVTAPRMADFLALVGDGLVGSYYNVADFDSTTVAAIPARTDAELDFYWGAGSPDPALPATGFGVRWKGFVVPQHDETYTFYVRAGDGARVWITSDLAVADPTTGVPLIDHWSDASEGSATIAMTGGQAYQIVVDYHFANPGADPDHPGAALVFSWSSLSTPKATVPQSSLYTRAYVAPATLAPAYLRLHRVAVLAGGLGLDAVELAYVNEHRADFSGFDATLLGTIAAPWPQWDALRAYVALRDRVPTADVTLLDVFAAGSVAMLAGLAGWDAAQAATLASQLGLQDAELRNASGPTRMRDTFLLAQRVGVSIDELVRWATNPPDHAQADDVIRAAKGRYDDASWATAAKPITDILRNQRRDALVAYALSDPAMATRNVIDENSLFEYFLIDVNMDACMQTSRLKQAISSAQLWVQRCLMNLEPAVSPSLLDADRWSWMKHYRVWEANRKVFLYPENWMDPTLRDDKTPFFEELEAQLLQGPLTTENLEAAVGDYLRKLDTVARLELCAVYRQAAVAGEDDGDLVHVIGRTANTPRAYYYRQFATTSEAWTPWQAIPLDIDGDHVIPCVWERRLYLFWTSFEQKPDAGQDLSGPSMDTDAHQQWEVASAAYEEYKKGLKLYNDTTTELEEIVTGGVDEDPANNPPNDPNPGDWFRDLLEQMYGTLGGIGNTNGEVVEQGRFPSPGDPGPEPAKSDDSAGGPRQHWEIKLAWAEYADGVWGTKQSCDTPLESYQHGSYKPTSEDHFFRVATGTGLAVYCYRRHQAAFDLPYSDAGFRIGHFSLDDCHGRMRVIQHDAEGNAPGQTTFPTPAGSRLSFMGYAELSGTSELIFTGPSPAFHERELLKATPRIYDVVPPCEPGSSSDGEVAYPFVFQDTRRVYLASPVRLPVPATSKGPSRPPLHFNYVASQDPTLTKIQGINTGDPGPEQAGSPVETVVVAGTGVASTFVSGVRSGITVPSALAGGLRRDAVVVERKLVTSAQTSAQTSASQTEVAAAAARPQITTQMRRYLRFHTSFHPFVCDLIKSLNKDGVAGVFTLAQQLRTNDATTKTKFQSEYNPNAVEIDSKRYPKEDVDFGGAASYAPAGAYAIYNWELFFHVPLLIATALMADQQYETARTWFHYIFDPTLPANTTASYWKTLPFTRDDAKGEQIVTLLRSLAPGGDPEVRQTVLTAIQQWRDDPFEPFEIGRLRISAFEKMVVIKYIQNLIAWGDQLFAQDTIEDINEATQLYVLGLHILGKRPQKSPARGEPDAQSYHDLRPHLDGFSNAWVTLENQFPFSAIEGSTTTTSVDLGMGSSPGFYFCIPSNDDLLALWDTIDDRLFKVRNCMNIGGVVRQLPLFEPPIDPALLVRAKAMGLDLASVLSDINSAQGPYRFTSLAQKANDLCGEVKGLGAALLTALEKNDAEMLALLRADQELSLLKAVKDSKKLQADEARANIDALEKKRDLTVQKQTYYQALLDSGLSSGELTQLAQLTTANQKAQEAIGYEINAQSAAQIPNATVGASGWSSPVVTAQFGGSNLSSALTSMARYIGGQGTTASYIANMSSIMASHARRDQDWNQQLVLSTKELDQLDKEIVAAQIKAAVAQKDLDNQQVQIDHSEAYEDFLRSKKYTNQQLYAWMVGKISAVYFQAYSAAYDLAKKAEKAYRYELGLDASGFINFGYWDSLHKGLLAADQLGFDLKRMEASYLDQNRRELELSKDLSLAELSPLALIELREQGSTTIDLPELVYDLDYPGHYMRRLRNVSLTIPCVVGPYTSVNCTLTLMTSKVRIDPTAQRPYQEDTSNPDPRFQTRSGGTQSIATSHAQSDGGLFEVSFRDERYLPFEGAGAVSTWQLSLPTDTNNFDFRTISDVIVHLKYTARDGGRPLADGARKAVADTLKGNAATGAAAMTRWMSARHELPNDWHRFLYPADAADDLSLALDLGDARFPYRFRAGADPQKKIRISSIEAFLALSDGVTYLPLSPQQNAPNTPVGNFMFTLTPPTGGPTTVQLSAAQWGLPHAAANVQAGTGTWQLGVTAAMLAELSTKQPGLCTTVTIDNVPHVHLSPEAIEDLWIVCHYSYK